jgi:hypothetical protein
MTIHKVYLNSGTMENTLAFERTGNGFEGPRSQYSDPYGNDSE